MNEQQKQRLVRIREEHQGELGDSCDACFLLTLLDQAQRDTERLELLLDPSLTIGRTRDGWQVSVVISSHSTLRRIGAGTTAREALDQAALARGEGTK